MFVDKELLAAPVILVSGATLEVVHSEPKCVWASPRYKESRRTIYRRRLVSWIVTGYASLVRWVPATIAVALSSQPSVTKADEPVKKVDDPGQSAAPPVAPPANPGELFQSVKTKKPRKDLSQFLVKGAENASKDR